MRISLNWVKRLIGVESLGVTSEELERRLTMHLAEIEGIERVGPELDGVVVGKVLTCGQHPNADKLSVTTVDVGGDEALPIVCGAPNVAAGQFVAVATVGTTLTMPGKDGEPVSITIKKGKLRGEASHGMICAEDELGLGDSHDGIMVLDGEPAPGTPLTRILGGGDEVLVIDNHNINHRPDLWGQLGWAREIAAILDLPAPAEPDLSWRDEGEGFGVRLEDARCSAYRGALISGINNHSSPQWMQDLLIAAGSRPHGLLVDITNFVMHELGEPMHAFDRRQLTGDDIIVRAATSGETLTLLDGKELALDGELVIADSKQPVALAGIMGGERSGCAGDTNTIVLEAATFAAANIRRTRIATGVSSDSASRFEKTLYPELTAAAINRAIQLLGECCPEMQVQCRFASQICVSDPVTIDYNHDALNRYIGFELSAEEQSKYLGAIGFTVDDGVVAVPWWRTKDVSSTADLIEEVARLHGYDAITPEVPRLPAAAPQRNELRQAEHACRRSLSRSGIDEVATYGFTSEAWCEALGWGDAIRLQHPLSSEMTVMRQSLLPNLAEAAARNRRFMTAVSIYEVGKIYGPGFGTGACTDERTVIGGVVACSEDEAPFYLARNALITMLNDLGYEPTLAACEPPSPEFSTGRCAAVTVDGAVIGHVGEVPGDLRKLAGLEDRLGWFHCELERLLAAGRPLPVAFAAPSRYQQVDRDFTFLCPERLAFAELEQAARKAGGNLVRAVELAQPVFRGDQLPDDHKAVSIRVFLQSDDKTLGEKELRKVSDKIVKTVEHTTAAKLRA